MKKMIKQKEYVVIGLSKFGIGVAKQLEANGCKVLAVDLDVKKVNEVADYVTFAKCMDVTNEEALAELGVKNFDGAIICIGSNMEAAIYATIWAKQQGVKQVIAKASSELYADVLSKVGADNIIFPEREMGIHLANNLALDRLFDSVELTDEYSIVDIPILKEWVGKNLIELKLREKYKVNVIAVKREGRIMVNPPAGEKLMEEDSLVMLGTNATLRKLANKSLSAS